MPSEIKAISPLVDRLTRMIEESHCVLGEEPAVGLALRKALNNAVLHGNRLDPCKLVQVHCRCELGKGLSMVVKDQGRGFDPRDSRSFCRRESRGGAWARHLHLCGG